MKRWFESRMTALTAAHLTFAEKRIVCRQTRRVVKALGLAFAGAFLVLASTVLLSRQDEVEVVTVMGLSMMGVGMVDSIRLYMKAHRMLAREARAS